MGWGILAPRSASAEPTQFLSCGPYLRMITSYTSVPEIKAYTDIYVAETVTPTVSVRTMRECLAVAPPPALACASIPLCMLALSHNPSWW